MHARMYLVLNLSTGCVSPQYHCRFDNFFETTCHNGPGVSGTISWQLLVGLVCAEMILSEVSAPTQHSGMYPETQSEANVPSEEISVTPPFHEFATDDHSISDGDSQVTDHLANPRFLIEVRELQVLSLLSQLVLANVVGFARCHEEWQNLLRKVSTIWHISPLSKKPMKTSSTTRTLNFKSGCEILSRSMQK